MNNIKRTSEEWSKLLLKGSEILDPDGWDRSDFQFSWYEESITEKEFISRAMSSTGMWTREFLESRVMG